MRGLADVLCLCCFSVMYGMGADTMSKRLTKDVTSFPNGVSQHEAQEHITRFFQQFPKIRTFFEAQKSTGVYQVSRQQQQAAHCGLSWDSLAFLTRLFCCFSLLLCRAGWRHWVSVVATYLS